MLLKQPLQAANRLSQFDVMATVSGGGLSGQAGAVRHGISKALTYYEPELRPVLKKGGFLTRDSRVVERKKYGKMKARRSFQFSKRCSAIPLRPEGVDMIDWLQLNLLALINVIVIDVVLAGDNAIIVGLAASRVKRGAARQRDIVGHRRRRPAAHRLCRRSPPSSSPSSASLLAGGLLLLWVCWKMYWELTHKGEKRVGPHGVAARTGQPVERRMSFRAAVTQIVVADVSMSLDNVLAVAGASKGRSVGADHRPRRWLSC